MKDGKHPGFTTTIIKSKEYVKGIPEFILSKIVEILDSYDKESTIAEGFLSELCPKCGVNHSKTIKGGKTSTGKQMFRCMDCSSGSSPTMALTHSIPTRAPKPGMS